MKPRVSAQGPGAIPDGGPRGLPPGWKGGGPPAECGQGDGVSGGVHRRGPSGSHPSIATGDKDWGLADGAAVNSKWDGAGRAGMARYRLPELWPRAPRPSQKL